MNRTGQEYRKKYPIIRPSIVKELAHGTTVSNLAYRVGKELGLPQEECYELAQAGLLHDIGKLELAKYVYGKEDETLVIEEMRYLRRHPRLSAEILERMGYSGKIVEMVRFHHENYDGSGYPTNLSGESIPFGARILRVCDVFAALTADRPYRKAFDVKTALELMFDEAKYYDIRVFLAFMNVVNAGGLDRILHTEDLEADLERLAAAGEDMIWPAPGAETFGRVRDEEMSGSAPDAEVSGCVRDEEISGSAPDAGTFRRVRDEEKSGSAPDAETFRRVRDEGKSGSAPGAETFRRVRDEEISGSLPGDGAVGYARDGRGQEREAEA